MLILVATSALLQIAYWLLLGSGFRRAGRAEPAPSTPPISVVVAARDEEAGLPELLEALSRQTHPEFEVVIVDDGSTDATPELLASWRGRMSALRVLRTAGEGKKPALSRGIGAASFDLLAFTDADCVPPPTWLSALAAAHAARNDEQVLIGYSPFRSSGSAVGCLARYETVVTGFLTAAAAGLGRPYMAVGRNLSYPRTVFDRVGGFASIMHSLSGDDDLFVQEVVRQNAAAVRAVLDPRSFVPTEAPRSWREWLRQKRRHASGGRFYAPSAKFHLGLFHVSNLIVWLGPLMLGWAGAAALSAKLLVQFSVLFGAAQRLRERRLMRWQPILEAGYLLYNVLIAPVGLLKIPERW